MINLNLQPLNRKRIIIFASGSGSNARCIIDHFADPQKNIEVALVVSNKENAGVLKVARERSVEGLVVEKEELTQNAFLNKLDQLSPDLIVLAGFLLKLPVAFVQKFKGKTINIHPSLLPKFGGKGMYGMNVHRAVHGSKESVSGCTIHWVNENYDEGAIIEQQECPIDEEDSPENIAKKVLSLEHIHYPKTIEKLLSNEP